MRNFKCQPDYVKKHRIVLLITTFTYWKVKMTSGTCITFGIHEIGFATALTIITITTYTI